MFTPEDTVDVGIELVQNGPRMLKAGFEGRALKLDDANLLRMWASHLLLTVKVTAAIHFEALRLWLKGVRIQHGTSSPKFSYSVIGGQPREVSYA